jgi:hypothetical protein
MPASNHLTFLITGEDNPFTAAGFGNWFRDVCREAKQPARCTSHGLRKAAATYLAELGATDHQLMRGLVGAAFRRHRSTLKRRGLRS